MTAAASHEECGQRSDVRFQGHDRNKSPLSPERLPVHRAGVEVGIEDVG